ncbi:hypothetical protein PHMEG_00011478 [Phytophthora megakarya]|uniref:Uncharacterized protein n=1 Tax=Phytophthora megakarya TaxID=4795 RepID=A0A225WB59_9STRA|nr:hypothetical protein PHMEG_00011478 [Phytophthora megakarya]
MSKHTCTQLSMQEKVELLRRWKTNPHWTLQEVAAQLDVKITTLKGWYDRYWDDLDTISVSGRKHVNGAGRPRIIEPSEADVLLFYKRNGSNRRPRDVLAFCLRLNEFIQDKVKPDSQKRGGRIHQVLFES